MKKTFAFILVLSMALALCACGGEGTGEVVYVDPQPRLPPRQLKPRRAQPILLRPRSPLTLSASCSTMR